ncbi:MAG: histidine kinase [Flavobacteriaceae bacterium]|nr:histidine kinase [Flavobacteriaceae bacterium]
MQTLINSRITRHLFFWLSIFAYFIITSNLVFFRDYKHLFESTVTLMVPQILIAYVVLDLLIPKLLNKNKYGLFIISLLLSLIAVFVGYVILRKYYFDVVYIDTYNELARSYAQVPLIERFVDPNLFFSKIVKFLTPAALLYTYRLYKNQQDILELREQKRLAELSALKNQLNPHFLFNTLNNLYALALERSDKTPEVIERLSAMLDYMLYRCKDNYVPLDKEVALIDNYLALEKIRYGKRVEITFKKGNYTNVKIAPLILLTFIENAFKHGVRQELDTSKIAIELSKKDAFISFSVTNTKPGISRNAVQHEAETLGLVNITKQLNLLYPKAFQLDINDLAESYNVQLNIPAYGL